MERWRGKTAVVTGAASGIGAAITRKLLQAGINVVGLDLQYERMQATAEQSVYLAGRFHPRKCDLASEEDLTNAFAWVAENLGPVAVMVNNAGVIDYRPVIESDRASFERIMNINIIAAASCISKAVQSMRSNKVEGHIFNITSVLGHVVPEGSISDLDGANGWNLYPASKHASLAMTQTVRREISRAALPVRITSISPGLVKTEISKNAEALKDLFEKVPALDPNDIADALIYALGTRPEVQVTEITVRRTGEVV